MRFLGGLLYFMKGLLRVNPLVILLFNLLLPISIMIPGNEYRHHFFLIFSITVLLLTGKWKRLLKFIAVYSLLMTFLHFASLQNNKAMSALYIFLMISIQFIPCLIMSSVLILDYTAGEIISAIQPLHFPKTFTVALVIVVRYIPTFKSEFSFIKESMRLRGIPYSITKPIQSFSFFLVPQLFRCSILADEITAAGLTKGITNPQARTSFKDMKMRLSDYVLSLILIINTVVITLWK